MKAILFWAATILSACAANAAQLDQVFQTHHDFAISLPDEWVEIPKAEIDKHFSEIYGNYPNLPREEFDYAYQLKSSENWFEYPYIMVQVQNTGKRKEPTESVLKENKSQILDGAKRGYEQGMAEMGDSLSLVDSASLDEGLVDWDIEHHVMWMGQRAQVANVGSIATAMAICLTENGILRVGLASKEADSDTYQPIFRQIVNSIEYGPSLKYQPDHSNSQVNASGTPPDEEIRAFASGKREMFDSKSHAKAKGVHLNIEYPMTWTAEEGLRPNIVQKFAGRDNMGNSILCALTIKDLPVVEPNEETDLLKEPTLREMISEMGNTSIIEAGNTKIEGEDAGWIVFTLNAERAGLTLFTHNLMFITIHNHKLINVGFTMSGKVDANTLSNQFAAYRPLFHLIANSIVYQDKWEQDVTSSNDKVNTPLNYGLSFNWKDNSPQLTGADNTQNKGVAKGSGERVSIGGGCFINLPPGSSVCSNEDGFLIICETNGIPTIFAYSYPVSQSPPKWAAYSSNKLKALELFRDEQIEFEHNKSIDAKNIGMNSEVIKWNLPYPLEHLDRPAFGIDLVRRDKFNAMGDAAEVNTYCINIQILNGQYIHTINLKCMRDPSMTPIDAPPPDIYNDLIKSISFEKVP